MMMMMLTGDGRAVVLSGSRPAAPAASRPGVSQSAQSHHHHNEHEKERADAAAIVRPPAPLLARPVRRQPTRSLNYTDYSLRVSRQAGGQTSLLFFYAAAAAAAAPTATAAGGNGDHQQRQRRLRPVRTSNAVGGEVSRPV